MKITLLSSCGLALQHDGQTLLIDALNKQFRCFSGLPPQTFAQMLAGEGMFAKLCGILCTHAHPDHWNAGRAGQLAAVSGAPVFVPDSDTPDRLCRICGPFEVEFFRIAHTPVPGWDDVVHGVFVVSCRGIRVYITADAAPDVARHRQILASRRMQAAFWNGQYLSHPETRQLLLEAAEKNYVYHIPVDPPDASGIRRKCERNMERFGAQLPGVILLEQYPAQITIE